MQVLVEMKVTILDGDEKGREFTSKRVEETDTQFTDIGVLEKLRLEWAHFHGMPTPIKVEEEKSCSECVNFGRITSMDPCSVCDNYSMFAKREEKEEEKKPTYYSCVGCKHVGNDGSKYPCIACKGYDKFEFKEE